VFWYKKKYIYNLCVILSVLCPSKVDIKYMVNETSVRSKTKQNENIKMQL